MLFFQIKNYDVRNMPPGPEKVGEGGKATKIDPNKKEVKIGWKHASFNEYLSDMISVERELKNVKPKL